MASYELKNNAKSTVADNPLAQSATTLNVATGEGANFPSSFPFKLTMWDAASHTNPGDDSGMEIAKCTGRTADALTIIRAQEGTADVPHALGERVAMLVTAGHFNDATTGIITKLDTIETNAKDDQTGAEIKAAYEAEADTNAFTDSEKAEVAANTVHKTSDGSDHTFIDQSVISGSSPTLDGANITNIDADTLIADVKEANVSAVTKGQMCAIVGSSGTKFEVQLCDCDDANLIRVLGLVIANTAQNETGQVVYKGLLTNVNTQIGNTDVNPNGETWAAGDMLYVSTTPGGLTNVRPSSGRCIKAGRTLKGNSISDTLLAIVNTNDISACAAAGEDLCNRMGDSDGVNKCSFKDYANNEVAAFDSNGNLTLIGTVDGIDVATDVAANNAKVTNATHTGEVTGSGALAINKTAISGKEAVTAVGTDYVLIGDTSDSNNLKKALVSDLAGTGTTITSQSFSSSPAHLTTDQDAGKAFTISSFPEHAQIKKISVRADFTAGQQSNTGSALINDGTGVAPADTSIVYDGDSPTDLFAADDQILIDSEWMDVTAVNTGTNTLTVTRGIKGTMAAYHDDNAVITKGNHGIRVVLFKDSNKKYSERIIELSSMMTYKGVTDAAISANDDYFGLTADIQNLGNGDSLVIEDTAEEICKVQNVNHDVASATYDYTIFVQDDLAAHDTTKEVKKLIIFDLDVPYSSGAGTLYGTVFIDEKITATANVKVEIETDSYT